MEWFGIQNPRCRTVRQYEPDDHESRCHDNPNSDPSLWQCDALTGAPDPEFGPDGVLELTIPQASDGQNLASIFIGRICDFQALSIQPGRSGVL